MVQIRNLKKLVQLKFYVHIYYIPTRILKNEVNNSTTNS